MRHVFDTSWGRVGVEANVSAITAVYLPGCIPDGFEGEGRVAAVLRECERQIVEYYDGKRKAFTVSVEASGTAFMRAVWERLCLIPYGSLVTYGDIAGALRRKGAARAVGMACGKNPVPLLVPCHRVVGAGNRLIGFSGGGVDVKRRLIEHEMGGLFSQDKDIVVRR